MHPKRSPFPKLARPVTLALLAFCALVGTAHVHSADAQGSAPVEPEQTFTGRVVEITDGDAFGLRRPIGRAVLRPAQRRLPGHRALGRSLRHEDATRGGKRGALVM